MYKLNQAMVFQEFLLKLQQVLNKNLETKAEKLSGKWKEEHSTSIFNSVIFIWLHMQKPRHMYTVDANFLLMRRLVHVVTICFSSYWILQCNFTTSAAILMLTSQERNYFVHHKNLWGLPWILLLLESSQLNSIEYL